MTRLESTITVESRLAWFLIWAGVVLFLGALFWGFLNPHMSLLRDTANASSAPSQTAETGWNRVMTFWSTWPLWFALGLMYGGYRRAINESKQNPGG